MKPTGRLFAAGLLVLLIGACASRMPRSRPLTGLVISNYQPENPQSIARITSILKAHGMNFFVIAYDRFRMEVMPDVDFVILSGGGIPIETNPKLDAERELCRRAPVPIFGICAGLQIIANAYGGTTVKLPAAARGLRTVRIPPAGRERLGLGPDMGNLTVHQNHGWAIRTPPPDFEALAVSEDGIEILIHNFKPILAAQFHPEVRPGNRGIVILEYFLKKMAAGILQPGDDEFAAAWRF